MSRLLSCALALVVSAGAAVHAHAAGTYQYRDLGTLGGTHSVAIGINDHGHVVGASTRATDGQRHAALWIDGRISDLGVSGASMSAAFSINNSGLIVGYHASPDLFIPSQATSWQNGLVSALDTTGGLGTIAFAVNNNG